jgi:hypothetical protein
MSFLRSFLGGAPAARSSREPAPSSVQVDGVEFALSQHMKLEHGYPIADWPQVQAWVEGLEPEARRAAAWTACERAWLLHFRDALGGAFRLDETDSASLVSAVEPSIARATLEFMRRTLRRIEAVLAGIAQPAPWGKDILIVLDDEESYYRYVSYYYPERGEFAFSGGMHINWGCSHFVTIRGDLRQIEPVIAHEMTHGCVGHLPLPAWLNEGLAVNTERRLTGVPPALYPPAKMHEKHRRFWSVVSIQDFWSGKSFLEPGDSNMLSYDLARILVEQLARDWEPFRRFVCSAERADGGAAAAHEHLGLDLGDVVTTLLERETPRSWAPDAPKWQGEPERGGF